MKLSAKSRREFLKAAGQCAALAPFVNLASDVFAQDAAPRLRFLGIFTPHCTASKYWLPRGTRTSFDISFQNSVLAPLAPFKDKLMILDGLGYRVLYEAPTPYSGHEGGLVTAFTGSQPIIRNSSVYAESESMDKFLAAQLGGSTRFSSFNFGGTINGGTQYDTYVFGPGGARITNSNQPRQSFDTLFNGVQSTTQPSNDEKLAQAARQSVLDFQLADLTRLKSHLGKEDTLKIDQHSEALREIERRLQNVSSVGCTIPTRPATTYDTTVFSKYGREIVKLHSEILAQAFACDLTRFATFGISPGQTAPWIKGFESITDLHEQIAHQYDENNETSLLNLSKLQYWYAEQVAYLLGLLNSIQDGNGRTVLDNTLVYWTTDVGQTTSHANTMIPVVLAGRAGELSKLMKMGQYVQLQASRNSSTASSIPHNKLLSTIAQAFGIQTNSFGNPNYSGILSLT